MRFVPFFFGGDDDIADWRLKMMRMIRMIGDVCSLLLLVFDSFEVGGRW